jgi:nicotinamide-nucleotide amidase
MPSAEIITIGTEILLGEIVDTNAHYLARTLRETGVDIYHKTSVGDNVERIAQAIRDAMHRTEIIITTGGLGPTIDDPTRQAISRAVNAHLEYRPELWEQIVARFKRYDRQPTENNKRQAYVPAGAIVIENPVGTAPAFIVEKDINAIIALPGVPREMEYLMHQAVIPYLKRRFDLKNVIKARILHTAGVGESLIDDRISDLETLSNPTVGLAAHAGQVDVRITAKASSDAEADAMILEIEKELRRRLGEWIYGADKDTLEYQAIRPLKEKGWDLVVVEAGLGGLLVQRLAQAAGPFRAGTVLREVDDLEALRLITSDFRQSYGASVGLGVTSNSGQDRQEVHLILITPEGTQEFARPYGGAPENASRWALHHSLDILRSIT